MKTISKVLLSLLILLVVVGIGFGVYYLTKDPSPNNDPKCKNIVCGRCQTCVDGLCVTKAAESVRCGNGVCPPGNVCNGGKCVLDTTCYEKCGAKLCLPGQTCDGKGACIPNKPNAKRCKDVKCPKSQFCDPSSGMCTDNKDAGKSAVGASAVGANTVGKDCCLGLCPSWSHYCDESDCACTQNPSNTPCDPSPCPPPGFSEYTDCVNGTCYKPASGGGGGGSKCINILAWETPDPSYPNCKPKKPGSCMIECCQ